MAASSFPVGLGVASAAKEMEAPFGGEKSFGPSRGVVCQPVTNCERRLALPNLQFLFNPERRRSPAIVEVAVSGQGEAQAAGRSRYLRLVVACNEVPLLCVFGQPEAGQRGMGFEEMVYQTTPPVAVEVEFLGQPGLLD